MTALASVSVAPADPRGDAPIAGYWIGLSCPRCAGQLIHVANGSPGLETRAVASCQPCRRQWCVVVVLTDVTKELGRPSAVPGGSCHATVLARPHQADRPHLRPRKPAEAGEDR